MITETAKEISELFFFGSEKREELEKEIIEYAKQKVEECNMKWIKVICQLVNEGTKMFGDKKIKNLLEKITKND